MIGIRGIVRSKTAGFRRRLLRPPLGSRLDQRPDLKEFEIGEYSWGHLSVTNRSLGCTLKVGRYCSIAVGTEVLLGGEHRTDFVSTYRFGSYPPFNVRRSSTTVGTSVGNGDVTIGNDVWIGNGVMILSGVTVGDGAVIGAGSVIRQNIPPYAITVGNPARVAGYRFEASQIEALMRIQWWTWEESEILEAMDLIVSEDIQAFIDRYDQITE